MKNVTVKTWEGKEVEGAWNEKVYSSNKSDHRIYINNQEIHITDEELQRISSNIEKIKKEQQYREARKAMIDIEELINKVSFDDKFEIVNKLLESIYESEENTKERLSSGQRTTKFSARKTHEIKNILNEIKETCVLNIIK